MRGAFATFALIGAMLLAGCTSTSGHPDGPTGPATTAGPVRTPVVTPTASGSAGVSAPPTQSAPVPVGTEVPADVPSTGPNLRHKGERPPVMPSLATQHTPAGAVAFAKFFELTIDWAYATTSTAYMRHYYEPSCVTCRSIQQGIDDAAKKHRHFVGGRMKLLAAVDRGRDNHYGAQRRAQVSYRLSAIEVVNKSGGFVDADPALTMTDEIWLVWHVDHWTVMEMGPTS